MNLPTQHGNRISTPLQLGRRLGRTKSAHCYGKELGGKARLLGALAVRSLRTVGRLDWADAYRGVGDLPTQSCAPRNGSYCTPKKSAQQRRSAPRATNHHQE